MEPTQAADPALLAHYEGLVIKTSSMYVGILKRYDFEDICQVLRVKVWKSLLRFEPGRYPPERVEMARDSFIFGCVRNEVKDLVKRNKEQPLLIEDIAPSRSSQTQGPRDAFEQQYLQVRSEEVFGEVEDSDPLVPNTLNHNERLVLLCMYLGYSQPEIAIRIGLERRKVATAVRNIRKKMQDWAPQTAEEQFAEAALPEPVAA